MGSNAGGAIGSVGDASDGGGGGGSDDEGDKISTASLMELRIQEVKSELAQLEVDMFGAHGLMLR
jgi:hypothetical protein